MKLILIAMRLMLLNGHGGVNGLSVKIFSLESLINLSPLNSEVHSKRSSFGLEGVSKMVVTSGWSLTLTYKPVSSMQWKISLQRSFYSAGQTGYLVNLFEYL